MSKAVIPLPVVAVEDPVTRLGRPTAFGVAQGGIVYTYQNIPMQQAAPIVGPQTVTFVCPPPSPDIIVDRRVYLNCTWQVIPSFANLPVGAAAFQPGVDGPRFMPNMQALQSVSAVINNNTITQQMDPIIALSNYQMSVDLQAADYSGAPSMPDQFQDYAAGFKANVNPLGAYGDNVLQPTRNALPVNFNNPVAVGGLGSQTPAGSTNVGAAGASTAASRLASATFTSIEPFFLTPFEQYGEAPGFFGVQTLNVTLNFNNSTAGAARVWSHAVTAPASAQVCNWTALQVALVDARLMFRYITPSPIKVMPSVMEYQYSQLNLYLSQTLAAVNFGATSTTVSPSIQFNTIPDQIFVYLARSQASRDDTTSDVYGVINNVSVNFMNQTGLLASASQFDLYMISRKNGYQGSLADWGAWATSGNAAGNAAITAVNGSLPGNDFSAGNYPQPIIDAGSYVNGIQYAGGAALASQVTLPAPNNSYRGSVLCIKPGLDLGLEPSLAPSMNGLYNFQITVTWYNNSLGLCRATANPPAGGAATYSPGSMATSYVLYVVPITSGIITIKDNGTVTQTGLLTRSDVLRAQSSPSLAANEAAKLVGGDFFNSLKNLLGRAGRSMYGGAMQMAQSLVGGSGCPPAEPSAEASVMGDAMDLAAGEGPSGLRAGLQGRPSKRKDMGSDFEGDPRERALMQHLRSPPRSPSEAAGSDYDWDRCSASSAGSRGGSSSGYESDLDGYPAERDRDEDRYVREPRPRDSRSAADRYDSAMPDIPPETLSRRRPPAARDDRERDRERERDRDMEDERPTPQGPPPRRGAVFR